MPNKIDNILSEALLEKGLLKYKDLEPISKQADLTGESLQQLLVNGRILHEGQILNVLAEKLKLNCVNLKDTVIDKAVLNKVPVKIAAYYRFIPLEIKDRVLTIAVSSPLDIKTQDEIRTQLGFDIDRKSVV